MSVKHDAGRLLSVELDATKALCESFDTPRSLTVWLLIHYEEFQQLVELEIEPHHYSDSDAFRCDYLVTSCLQKNPRLPLNIDRRAVALSKFRQAEQLCSESNRRFEEGKWQFRHETANLVCRIRSEVSSILGSFPTRGDLEFVEAEMRFGPGATTTLSGVVTQGAKYQKRFLGVTPELVNFRTFCFPELWKQNAIGLTIQEHSKFTTVPKNAKTDRAICIEPDLNVYVQLGIGALLRRKLLRSGIDLNTQEHNQRAAKAAISDGLATVDLSAASDTISKGVVSLLLPPYWVELLALARTPSTKIDGEITVFEKWSSMGNGYTFELETIIFLATARAVCPAENRDDILAYGDDIIIPRQYLPNLIDALDFLGFKVNQEKTFGDGLFYESCGTDWFDGVNVRPVFFRSKGHDVISSLYTYLNGLRRWAAREGYLDVRVLPAYLRILSRIPKAWRLRIPFGYGDVGIESDFDQAQPVLVRKRETWGGYSFFHRKVPIQTKVVSMEGSYLSCLRSPSEFTFGYESLRGRYLRPTKVLGYSLEWPSLGPWL